jgi:hypothetical protein
VVAVAFVVAVAAVVAISAVVHSAAERRNLLFATQKPAQGTNGIFS